MENIQLISSDGLLHGDLVRVTKKPVHPINEITKENSSQVQHLVGCHYQEVSAPEIRSFSLSSVHLGKWPVARIYLNLSLFIS